MPQLPLMNFQGEHVVKMWQHAATRAHLKQNKLWQNVRDLRPFCDNPVCPGPVWKPAIGEARGRSLGGRVPRALRVEKQKMGQSPRASSTPGGSLRSDRCIRRVGPVAEPRAQVLSLPLESVYSISSNCSVLLAFVAASVPDYNMQRYDTTCHSFHHSLIQLTIIHIYIYIYT